MSLFPMAWMFLFSFGQEPALFARTPDISPDATKIVFSYLGDIWQANSDGKNAIPITSHPAHDYLPCYSPDGNWIAFSSNRHGSYDVFLLNAKGGKPKRVTHDSANDLVCGWSPDSKTILFSSNRAMGYPAPLELYSVPLEGGNPRRLTFAEAKDGAWHPKEPLLAYSRGPGAWYRKGYRGSANDELWIGKPCETGHVKLTNFNGQDGSAMWSPNGDRIYYVSEFFSPVANIVYQEPKPDSKPVQLTKHTSDSVRRARISAGGKAIVYECGDSIYVLDLTPDSKPKKLVIPISSDDKTNPEKPMTFTQGASDFAISKDEQAIIYSVHGELFRMGNQSAVKAARLTDHPADDFGAVWAPDSSKAAFLSDRTGKIEIYLLESADTDHPKLMDAHQFKHTRITKDDRPESNLTFSPDGKKIYFVRSGILASINLDGSGEKPIVPDGGVGDYQWSPDGKWIVYSKRDAFFASELFLVGSEGPTPENPARNITRYATSNFSPSFSNDGKKLAFISERRSSPSVFVMDLYRPTAKPTPNQQVDFEEIHLRVNQVGSSPANEVAISPNGSRVAYRSGNDLWVANVSGGQNTRLTTGNLNPTQIRWSRKMVTNGIFNDIIYFKDGNGQLRSIRGSSTGTPSDLSSLSFKAKMIVRPEEENLEIFDQCWRLLADNFYDRKFHGSNWNQVRDKYRPMVKHSPMKEDFQTLIFLMLGELNASHLGITMGASTPEEITGEMGILFDERHEGNGLKIKEILTRGPVGKLVNELKPGDIIANIQGVELTPKIETSKLLNGTVDETIVITVIPRDAKDPLDVKSRKRYELNPVPRDRLTNLFYERWVSANAKQVEKLSNGKLGYIHIPSMDEAGLDRFVRALYSENFGKEALVLDVRFNGGGFTHDQILNYLGAREHTIFRSREGEKGLVLRSYDRKWTKPIILLINNRSYSDAEIFPSAFKTLGLGKLVGQPTGGMVIGTVNTKLMDGSSFRLPRLGVYTSEGIDMDTRGVKPDFFVEPTVDELMQGKDSQLEKAVEELSRQLQNAGDPRQQPKK